MFNQIFVSYLAQKNVITQEQAAEILEIQDNTKIRIGVLAMEEKLMTPAQVDEVNNLQASTNARFGDIAVQKGYLTKEQLEYLLNKQPKEHFILKQILTDKQYMKAEQVDTELNGFKSELNVGGEQFDKLLEGDIETYVSCIAGIDGGSVIMKEYAKTFISLTIRFIDREFFIKKAKKARFDTSRFIVSQKAAGHAHCTFMFGAEDINSAAKFAGKFAKDTFDTSDGLNEDAQDSLKEFLNCVTGLVISDFYNDGIMELDIEAPEYSDELSIDAETLILPFSLLNAGDFYIFIKMN